MKLHLDENFDNVQVEVQAVADPIFVAANEEHDENKEKYEAAMEANEEATEDLVPEEGESIEVEKREVLKQMHLEESLFTESIDDNLYDAYLNAIREEEKNSASDISAYNVYKILRDKQTGWDNFVVEWADDFNLSLDAAREIMIMALEYFLDEDLNESLEDSRVQLSDEQKERAYQVLEMAEIVDNDIDENGNHIYDKGDLMSQDWLLVKRTEGDIEDYPYTLMVNDWAWDDVTEHGFNEIIGELEEDFKKGDKFKNQNGATIEILDADNDFVTYEIKAKGDYIGDGHITDPKSVETVIGMNGYEKIEEEYDSRIGGDTEDFVADLNDIRNALKDIELATPRAEECLSDIIEQIEFYENQYLDLDDIQDLKSFRESLETSDFEERKENCRLMHEVMMAMNDEDAYFDWIYTMPDEPDEDDFAWFAEDDEEYKELVDAFNRIYNRYKKYGLYEPSDEVVEFLKKHDYKYALEESLNESALSSYIKELSKSYPVEGHCVKDIKYVNGKPLINPAGKASEHKSYEDTYIGYAHFETEDGDFYYPTLVAAGRDDILLNDVNAWDFIKKEQKELPILSESLNESESFPLDDTAMVKVVDEIRDAILNAEATKVEALEILAKITDEIQNTDEDVFIYPSDERYEEVYESLIYNVAKEQLKRFTEGKMGDSWNPKTYLERLENKKYLNEEQIKKLNENFHVVDLEDGESFGDYENLEDAKVKAAQYTSMFNTKAAVVDDNEEVVDALDKNGKSLKESVSEQTIQDYRKRINDLKSIDDIKEYCDQYKELFYVNNGEDELQIFMTDALGDDNLVTSVYYSDFE